jgi:hypothetical protein
MFANDTTLRDSMTIVVANASGAVTRSVAPRALGLVRRAPAQPLGPR